ncbi:MAG: hypothetical protein ACE5FO_10305 [Parvularculaceae bacterium]
MRNHLRSGASLALLLSAAVGGVAQAQDKTDDDTQTAADRYLELGTDEGVLGGEEQKTFERSQIKTQILTFIPPLLRPAFTQHAFVLPPGAMSVGISHRYTRIEGDDFFRNGDPNLAVFQDFSVERNLTDIDFFYGFDLNRKYLHGFTLRVNVPYLNSSTDGFIHPNGQQFISLENAGSTQEIGDVGVFLKKKVWDQGNHPFGLAVVGAAFFPTGANDETFGSNGRITAKRPQPPNLIVAQGFDALMQANVAAGVWGDSRCFFRNFNLGNRALCDGPAAGPGGPFGAPSAGPLSFAPGGPNFDNAFVGDFPFNNGIFGRFSGDGRLPSTLQPGTGDFSFLTGGFITRQFPPNSFMGRSAGHIGVVHRFVQEEDGIDFGDTTTYFASFVKPIYKDFIAMDLTFVGFDKQNDSYAGKIPEPEIHICDAIDVAGSVGGCAAVGDEAFVFDVVDRPPFSGGFTGMVAPSLIYSPDPQIRLVASGLIRVIEPDLGPAPPFVLRVNLEVIF